jgi:hypothetical protein
VELVEVTTDYWELKLNAQTLNNIRNGRGTTFILGRADVGGGVGEHWVVIEDYSVDRDGTITYTVRGTSNRDDKRTYTSGPNNDSEFIGQINRIETYTIR